MSNATKRICELLDERGVEWTYADGTVSYSNDGHWCHAWAYSDNAMCVSMGYFTPEQAIAATLGSGTCEIFYKGELWWECQSCGEEMSTIKNDPNFCSNCGRAAE